MEHEWKAKQPKKLNMNSNIGTSFLIWEIGILVSIVMFAAENFFTALEILKLCVLVVKHF